MKCPFCFNTKEDVLDDNVVRHTIITTTFDGKVHVHAPFDDPRNVCNHIEKFIIEAEKHGIIYNHRV